MSPASNIRAPRSSIYACFAVALIMTCATRSAVSQSRVIVNHDEWATTDLGFGTAQAGVAATFALNVGNWLTGGGPGNFLVVSTNFAYTGSQMTATMTGAGHAWTIWSPALGIPLTAAGLQPFDAVFLGGQIPGGASPPTAALAAYVQNGGSLYLVCGTGPGQFASSAVEAATWNPLLASFGLVLSLSYNTLMGVYATTYAHPIFAGVPSLYCHFGNSVSLTGVSPSTTLFSLGADGQFGIYDGGPPIFQVNQAQAALAVNGVAGTAHLPPSRGGASGFVDIGSTLVGGPWDLAITIPDPILPIGGGGFPLIDGQIVNLNIGSSGFFLLNGGFAVGGFPGSFSLPYVLSPGSPTISSQLVVLDPASLSGLRLSAPARILP